MFTHNRKSIDLNGTWKFNPDPYQRCKQQKWWEGEGPDTAFFPCFNLEGLWDTQVPGTWKTQFEELKWYDGDANYVKEFAVEDIPEGHEAFLCFDGIVYAAEVYLNGEHVGSHDWGYSPFQLRVTDQLREQNRLFVLVENRLREDRVPGIRFDWNNDGGIINSVNLIFVPKIHIENFRTWTRLDGGEAVIGVECSVSRTAPGGTAAPPSADRGAAVPPAGSLVSEYLATGKPTLGKSGLHVARFCRKRASAGCNSDTPKTLRASAPSESPLTPETPVPEIGAPVKESASLPVTIEIPELGIKGCVEVPAGGSATVEFRIPCTTETRNLTPDTLLLWSPDNPKLYTTTLTTPYETLTDEIGYREIRTEGQQILLNGEPIRLYGVAVHAEFPGTGRTATEQGVERMLTEARELGCNFLRCAHYPYADLFARAMDRAGMLWWEEVPVYWLPHIHEPSMKRLALGMLRDAVERDWNRAGLLFWSVSNECALGSGASSTLADGNYPYWAEAARLVRELDPSRLISAAECTNRVAVNTKWTPEMGDEFDEDTEVEVWEPAHPDAFYDLFDVLGGNLYVPSPGANPEATYKFARMLRRFNKPLMLTEFGAMSTTDPSPDRPENVCGHPKYHEAILRDGYRAFYDCPEIVGYVPWSLMDVRVPMHWRWYNRGSATFAYGFLDNDYNKKPVYAVVKDEIAKLKAHWERSEGR